MNILFPLLTGFGTGGCLIVAIGAQNAFVLKQGLMRHRILLTALTCSLLDSGLIISGTLGFGGIIEKYPFFIQVTKYFAAIFLIAYGLISFRSALKVKHIDKTLKSETLPTAKRTLLILLALSLLNPHVYLDTVILLGSIASQHPSGERIFFTLGAIIASFLWFFSLSYGARLLDPFLKKKRSWSIIDFIIALIMWSIALTILFN